MKRKLNEDDVPSKVAPIPNDSTSSSFTKFEDFNLDARILQAVQREQFTQPTPVQAQAIPLALEGRDIIARARTGSGKTAAYVLPVLQSILKQKASSPIQKAISTLVLVPTRELAEQIHKVFVLFSAFCSTQIRSVNLTQQVHDAVLRSILAGSPDVVISTPGKASQSLSTSAFSLEYLKHLIIDEADLVLSYGYEDDINAIAKALPRGVQTFLMSATLTAEVDTLRGLFCRDPAVLKLEENEESGEAVKQYVVKCAEDEKFLLIYVIFKLKLVKGKCIVFVSDVDRSYRVKLFLEQFSVKSCVLNSELPVNSRIHVVEEFNKGVYDIIIAADDQEILGEIGRKEKTTEVGRAVTSRDPSPENGNSSEEDAEEPRKRRKLTVRGKDYGISRGIDFQNVACVINFDLPTSAKSYIHRIGRTARAGKSGMALSFVVPRDMHGKHKPTSITSAKHDEGVLDKIIKRQAKKGNQVQPYHFDMQQVDAFRYRMSDALRAVTRLAIQEARTRELKQELLKSEKLKRHFEENQDDLRYLRHDNEIKIARVQPHLKHVPQYLMPTTGRKGLTTDEVGFVSLSKPKENRIRKARMHNRTRGKSRKVGSKKLDPLKSFSAKGRR